MENTGKKSPQRPANPVSKARAGALVCQPDLQLSREMPPAFLTEGGPISDLRSLILRKQGYYVNRLRNRLKSLTGVSPWLLSH